MGEIKAELNAELQTHIAFEIPLFGGIPVPESAVVSWVIIAVLTLLAVWLTHGLRKRPGRRQAAAEMLVGFINGFCRDTLGDKYWHAFAPYLGTVGLYLALANMAGLFGNIFAGFVIMELVKMVVPVVVPIPLSLYFDVFDGMIQAVVFVFLTTLFLSESLE